MESNLNRVTAVLGPTNTGKTHIAIDEMLKYEFDIHRKKQTQHPEMKKRSSLKP